MLRGLTILLTLVAACNSPDSVKDNQGIPEEIMDEAHLEREQYLSKRDLDGDGTPDSILFDYSGGAHCCYSISIGLSSEDSVITYPFEMDGGYIMGVDGSTPDQFAIEDFDGDGLVEIFMEISTYNGQHDPIDSTFTKKYGITSNHILFDYQNGRMLVKDFSVE